MPERARLGPPPPRRRAAFATDDTRLRGAKRPADPRLYSFSAVRHQDALTVAAREVGAKTNATVTLDALHTQRVHARCLIEGRGAHFPPSVQGNQMTHARQGVRIRRTSRPLGQKT